jgi:peptide deformylase
MNLIPAHTQYPERFALISTNETALRRISKQVDIASQTEIDTARILIKKLKEILILKPDTWATDLKDNLIGYGIEAIQLKELESLEHPPKVGIIRIPKIAPMEAMEFDMINPDIISLKYPYKYKDEGCLSFPGKYLRTNRFRYALLEFLDANTLETRSIPLYGFYAVTAQHEVDHAEGILFMDRINVPVKAKIKTGPNEPCPCGSKKKYKKCCSK